MLSRPGFRTSEFVVALATFVGYCLNAAADWTTTQHASLYSIPALVFILSRGLAKYEQRNTTPPAGG